MKQSRVYIFIISLLFFSVFLLNVSRVYAYQMYESLLEPHSSCVNDRSCLLICSYTEEEKKKSADGHLFSTWNATYIYYIYDTGEWQITWDKPTAIVGKNDSIALSSDELLSSDVIHAQSGVLNKMINTGVCPNYAHVDRGYGKNEVCFDNDGEYCADNVGSAWYDISTSFGKCSDSLVCSKKYDVNNQIMSYLDNFNFTLRDINLSDLDFNNISSEQEDKLDLLCEDLRDKNISVSNQLVTDFSVNFLNNASAEFMSNWNSYLYVKNNVKKLYDSIINKLNKYCNDKVDHEYESGMITEEERDEITSQNNQSSQDLINNSQNDIDSGFNIINEGNWVNIDTNLGDCSDYIGDADVQGTPAYYIDFVYDIIKIVIVVTLILLSMFDLVNAIISEKALNGIYKKLIYRLIIVILILLLPTLISLVGQLLTGKDILCGIG